MGTCVQNQFDLLTRTKRGGRIHQLHMWQRESGACSEESARMPKDEEMCLDGRAKDTGCSDFHRRTSGCKCLKHSGKVGSKHEGKAEP